MNENNIRFDLQDGIGIATFQRVEAHHAINSETSKELEKLLDQWERQSAIRCLILTATGTKSFVSGGDLKYFAEILENKMVGLKFHRQMRKSLKRLSSLPFPVICAANGDTYGGGCEVALSADIILIESNASFHFRQAEVGLSTGWGGGPRLVRRVGLHQACRLLLTGKIVSAIEAKEIGLVDEVVDGDFTQGMMHFAQQIVRYQPEVIHNLLRMLRAAGSKWWDIALQTEVKHFERLWGGPAFRKAVEKFVSRGMDKSG